MKLDISPGHYDGLRFVFGGQGLEQHPRSSRRNCSLASQRAARITALYAEYVVSDFPGAALALPAGTSVLIEGQAGVGKTVFALQMACHYLEQLHHSDRDKEYVLYVAFEQDALSLSSLLTNFDKFGTKIEICPCPFHDPTHDLLPQKLHILSRPPSTNLSSFIDSMGARLNKSEGCALLLLDSIGFFENDKQGGTPRDQLDRLCQRAREDHYALVMVREKEPSAAAAVSEYITDNVFELQLKPINASLSYGGQVRTIEIKKSRAQKSHRGPHEFEIDEEQRGIIVFPSPDSVFPRTSVPLSSESRPLLKVFEGVGDELLARQLEDFDPQQTKAGLVDKDGQTVSGLQAGESLLLYGAPGSLKTSFGFNFLRLALKEPEEACLFVTFKIAKRALDGIARSYLSDEEYADWSTRNIFIDARQTFWTPARVLAEIRMQVLQWRKGRGDERQLRRAVVFGLGMIDKLPAFQGQELTFLQVLVSYFDAEGISAIFIDWPQQALQHSQLYFDSIVNYFSTTIQRVKPDDAGPLLVRVTRHQFQVVNHKTLSITECSSNGRRALQIEEAPEASGRLA